MGTRRFTLSYDQRHAHLSMKRYILYFFNNSIWYLKLYLSTSMNVSNKNSCTKIVVPLIIWAQEFKKWVKYFQFIHKYVLNTVYCKATFLCPLCLTFLLNFQLKRISLTFPNIWANNIFQFFLYIRKFWIILKLQIYILYKCKINKKVTTWYCWWDNRSYP